MLDVGDDLEFDGAHVQEHAGDVDERGEEEDALPPEEAREEEPSDPLGEGPAGLGRGEPALGPAMAVARRP